MKKVKIMLMAIMVLAIAGGALAFKTKFGNDFCTVEPRINPANGQPTCTDADGDDLFCSETVFDGTTTEIILEPEALLKCTTELDPIFDCSDIECPTLTYTTTEEL